MTAAGARGGGGGDDGGDDGGAEVCVLKTAQYDGYFAFFHIINIIYIAVYCS